MSAPFRLVARQRKFPVNVPLLKRIVGSLLSAVNARGYKLRVVVSSDRYMSELNKMSNGDAHPTDILSFRRNIEASPEKELDEEDKHLGSIHLSARQVFKQAQELNTTVNDRFARLLVHGMCHLLGYDHHDEEERIIMSQREKVLLQHLRRKFSNELPANPPDFSYEDLEKQKPLSKASLGLLELREKLFGQEHLRKLESELEVGDGYEEEHGRYDYGYDYDYDDDDEDEDEEMNRIKKQPF